MNFEKALEFLKKLKKNNNKVWFDSNRNEYEIVKKDFQLYVAQLISQINSFDETIIGIEPKNCIFRINKDVRFSKDKSPYKTNIGAIINKGGKKMVNAGYYIHVEPGDQSFLAGGLYMPDSESLKKIRQEIDYNFKEFKNITNQKLFKSNFKELGGEKLSNIPKGYSADNEAIEFLKHKSFIVVHSLTDNDLKTNSIDKHINVVFKSMKPLNDFLNQAISE